MLLMAPVVRVHSLNAYQVRINRVDQSMSGDGQRQAATASHDWPSRHFHPSRQIVPYPHKKNASSLVRKPLFYFYVWVLMCAACHARAPAQHSAASCSRPSQTQSAASTRGKIPGKGFQQYGQFFFQQTGNFAPSPRVLPSRNVR